MHLLQLNDQLLLYDMIVILMAVSTLFVVTNLKLIPQETDVIRLHYGDTH